MLRAQYGHLGQGDHLLVSSVSFDDLTAASGLPPLFMNALQAWGRLPTRRPRHAELTYEELRYMPVLFSPAAVRDGYEPTQPKHIAPRRQLPTQSGRTLLALQRQHANEMARRGIRVFGDLLPCIDVLPSPSGQPRATLDEHALDQRFPSSSVAQRRRLCAAVVDIVRSWPDHLLGVVAAGRPYRCDAVTGLRGRTLNGARV